MHRAVLIALASALVIGQSRGSDFRFAAAATNTFGIDLYQKVAVGEANLCLSPYSISSALAMAYGGSMGETRSQMARVLHLDPKAEINGSFQALQKSLADIGPKTAAIARQSKESGGPSDPITIAVANRLFPQAGYHFRSEFFARMQEFFGAAPEVLDFKQHSVAATKRINDWVAKQTFDRIRDLIPEPLDPATRLVLGNALYLKAPWAEEFATGATTGEPFHIRGREVGQVLMMRKTKALGYAKRDDFSIVALPYSGGDLQFVVLLPDRLEGLSGLEKKLTPDLFALCAKLEKTQVTLHFPKFQIEPPSIRLAEELKALGMTSAFDVPPGSANFEGIAPRMPNDYLAISEVFHKTFISVDEHGTEAAAATAAIMRETTALLPQPSKPIEIIADHPFVYAIQHVPSGACLFLGRVTDPRSNEVR
jgi:serpin B